uniref:2'-phosphotransferase n=1 Tax=Chenopodium quinoa TaxID=63459 RepID=A0A803NB08_CHEQI
MVGGRESISFSFSSLPSLAGGREHGDTRSNRGGSRGCGRDRGAPTGTSDSIDTLGRLLVRILRHNATELNLDMRNDGYVKLQDLLKLNMKTSLVGGREHGDTRSNRGGSRGRGRGRGALSAHTYIFGIDSFSSFVLNTLHFDTDLHIFQAIRIDNKQRLGLLEEDGELWIRANQGHTVKSVESESLLKPILSTEEVPVCVHGTHKRLLQSILASDLKRMSRLHVHFSCGLRSDGEVKSDGMKFYKSENEVILIEGFDGVVPVKYFQKIESWPKRNPVPFEV